jgi:hypothetical protein
MVSLRKNLALMWIKVILMWQGSIIGLVAKLFGDDAPGILTEEFPRCYKDS